MGLWGGVGGFFGKVFGMGDVGTRIWLSSSR